MRRFGKKSRFSRSESQAGSIRGLGQGAIGDLAAGTKLDRFQGTIRVKNMGRIQPQIALGRRPLLRQCLAQSMK